MTNLTAENLARLCPTLVASASSPTLPYDVAFLRRECNLTTNGQSWDADANSSYDVPDFYISTTVDYEDYTVYFDTEEDYWPMHIRILMSIVFTVFSVVGIIGNILVITVVLKVPGMITPTNCYLVSLAASDCLFFVAAAPTELSYLHVPSSRYIFGQVGCAVFSYLPYLAINTSSMSITAFTVERFIGICYPLRARYICTVKRAKLIICLIWLFGITYNSPWLYLATLKIDGHGESCSFKLARDNWTYKVMFLGDFAAFYLLPMILYVFIYGKITYTLTRSGIKGSIRTPDEHKGGSNGDCKNHSPTSNGTATSPTGHKFFAGGIGRKNSTRGRVQLQVIKMLAVVVFIFAVCWLPYRAMVMYNSFASSRWDPDWYIFLSKTMIFFNCAINPILYNLMSAKFRQAFGRLLKRRKSYEGHNIRNVLRNNGTCSTHIPMLTESVLLLKTTST
ncbi:CRE-NMUR-4 protein [Aphelenchoides avenae]|nr:CRE-NMUR-4 protein [Aphelenchus avenae]